MGNVFFHLGMFHLMLCFLSCVGRLMRNTGITDVLTLGYTPLSVEAILNGKAFNRAIRGHSLLHRALYNLLLEPHIKSELTTEDIEIMVELYDRLVTDIDHEYRTDDERSLLQKVRNSVKNVTLRYCETGSKTALLWIQYLQMIDILFELYFGERTGDFEMSITAAKHMLPLSCCRSVILFTKCLRLY